jgi:hypothetical protein
MKNQINNQNQSLKQAISPSESIQNPMTFMERLYETLQIQNSILSNNLIELNERIERFSSTPQCKDESKGCGIDRDYYLANLIEDELQKLSANNNWLMEINNRLSQIF